MIEQIRFLQDTYILHVYIYYICTQITYIHMHLNVCVLTGLLFIDI